MDCCRRMDWSTSGYECIAELAEALTHDHEGECISLHGRTICFSLRSFAHIPAKFISVAMWPKRPAKRKGTDKWPLFSLAPLTYPATVCSISGSGTTLWMALLRCWSTPVLSLMTTARMSLFPPSQSQVFFLSESYGTAALVFRKHTPVLYR